MEIPESTRWRFFDALITAAMMAGVGWLVSTTENPTSVQRRVAGLVGAGVFVFAFKWCLSTIMVGMQQRRRYERRMANHCINCDYDLRASVGVCPECGTPLPAVEPTA